MNKLPEDILSNISQFLDEITCIKLFTCNKYLIETLNYINKNKVQIISTDIVPQKGVEWFEKNGIKIKLIEKYAELNGTQKWYKNGKLHRDNDLPAIIY